MFPEGQFGIVDLPDQPRKPFAAGSKDALLLGDSWAAYAGTSLKDHCAPRRLQIYARSIQGRFM